MKNFFKRFSTLFLSSLLLSSCSIESFLLTDTNSISISQNTYSVSSDRSLAAENFYEYVNQSWLQETKDPTNTPTVSAFSQTTSANLTAVYQTLENNLSEKVDEENSNIGKLTRFYASVKDTDGRTNAGVDPIKPYLDLVLNAPDLDSLQDAAAQLDLAQLGNFVSFRITPDAKDSTVNRLYLNGPVLGLSNRSYYDTSENAADLAGNQKMIAAYQECLVKLLMETGLSEEDSINMVSAGYSIEEQLALSTLSSEDAQNSEMTYNKYKLSTFSSKMDHFDLTRFLSQVGIENPEYMIVEEVEYYMTLDELFIDENLEALRAYIYMIAVFQASNLLSPEMVVIREDFDNVIYGTTGYSDPSSQGLYLCRLYMEEQIGELYVKHYFSESTKEAVTEMVNNILLIYKKRIENLDWMNEKTKISAIQKLDNISVKVGYPDQWSDLSTLEIASFEEGGSLFQNVVNLYQYDYAGFCAKLDQPVNRSNWEISAFETNAYYKNSANEIVIPAGILRDPFYSPSNTPSQNYGAIGVVIAHEISHAFDGDGRKYDENGSLDNWWTSQDLKNYNARTEALVAQYNNYEVYPGSFINGTLTLNENIADLGALSCITELIGELPDGQGNYEEMFEAYATIYREKTTETYGKRRLIEDPHAPSICRVNEVVSNIDIYYDVYGVGEGNAMYRAPEERIQIW